MTLELDQTLGADNPISYIVNQFIVDRYYLGKQTLIKTLEITVEFEAFNLWLSHIATVSTNSSRAGQYGVAKYKFSKDEILVKTVSQDTALSITLYGNWDNITQFENQIKDTYTCNPCTIEWVFDPKYLESIKVSAEGGNSPFDEMYPWLEDETLTDYYHRFMNSKSNILILIGVPGTGKTTFTRGLLQETRQSAMVTYSEEIIRQDEFFTNWYRSKNTFLIMEDSDTMLLPRTDGNSMMTKFLSLGDGLMSFPNKKMIFSTNLPNVSDIDPALTRPGRCFDIIKFAPLTQSQGIKLCNKLDIPYPGGSDLTVSEIFNAQRNEVTNKKRSSTFGFI